VWNLEKFGKMIKDQLLQKGSNCRIMREEDVTIANGRMKGRDIVYIAGTQALIPWVAAISPPHAFRSQTPSPRALRSRA
jgi:hypothetical protein